VTTIYLRKIAIVTSYAFALYCPASYETLACKHKLSAVSVLLLKKQHHISWFSLQNKTLLSWWCNANQFTHLL